MRKTLIILTVAVIMVVPGLTGLLHAREKGLDNGAAGTAQRELSEGPHGAEKMDREAAKAAEVRKAEETKQAEEAKKIIVARVNGEDINMFMLVRAMNMVAPRYLKKGEAATSEISGEIRKEALDRLIFEELAVQEAIKQGINPAPEAIGKVLAQVRENAGSEGAYREYLDKSFLTEAGLKEAIERSQRYELITAREIYEKVKVDEELLRETYEKEKGRFVLPDNFVVEEVFFLQGKDEETTRKKAGEVLETIRKKNNDVWKLVLDGTFIVRKTNIRKEIHPEIYKAVAGMKAGDLSGVIGDKDGFHIIKVTKKEPSRQLTFEEAKNALEPKYLVPAQEQRKEEWEKELRKDAKIEILSDGNIN